MCGLATFTDVPLSPASATLLAPASPAGSLDDDAQALPTHLGAEPSPLGFDAVYEEHFPFVWRSVRRLGVDASYVDDVVQDVFVVVHRKLPGFELRTSVRGWLFGILALVVRNHRRTLRRKPAQLGGAGHREDADDVSGGEEHGPHELAAKAEAVRTLHAVLETLSDERREVFVLAELEQMTAPEIAEAIGGNVNTVYSRLRAARAEFEEGLARFHAKGSWRFK